MANSIRAIIVRAEVINNQKYSLKIRPYTEKDEDCKRIKDTIKYSKGKSEYNHETRSWILDLKYYEILYPTLLAVCGQTQRDIHFENFNKIEEKIKELNRISQSSIFDFAASTSPKNEEPESAVSAVLPVLPEARHVPKTKPVSETRPERIISKPVVPMNLISPVLSEEKCVYTHLCRSCKKGCTDFLSVADAYANRCNVSIKSEEIVTGATYYGKSRYSQAQGYFHENGKLFFVKAGSQISRETVEILSEKHVAKRNELKKSGLIDENNRFVVDYPFSGPNEATCVVTGSTVGWNTYWHTEEAHKSTSRFIAKNAPTFASAVVGESEITAIPVIKEDTGDMTVKVLEGNKIPEITPDGLSFSLRRKARKFADMCDKDGRLKVDYTFDSSAEAAKILTGDMNANSSIWRLTDNITLANTEFLHSAKKIDGHEIVHLESSSHGTFSAGYATKTGFVIKAGSIASSRITRYCPSGAKNRYKALIEEEAIINGVFVKDVEFSSPSGAAAVCCGTSMDGSTAWKKKNGEPLNSKKRSERKNRR